MPTEEELHLGFTLGECEIHYNRGVVIRDGEEVRPEPQTWRVLICLAKRDGGLVTKEDLVEEVWDGRPVADDPINRAIAQARRALGDNTKPPQKIETLQRRGYRLLEPVELHQPAEPEQPVVESNAEEAGPSIRQWRIVAALLSLGLLITILLSGVLDHFWQKPVRSIAVMPFENLTGSADDDFRVSGFKTELIASLTAIDDLVVRNVKRNYDLEYDALCEQFEVERVLEATVRRQGDRLIVNYTIADAEGSMAPSDDIDGSDKDLHGLQKRMAELVAAELGGVVLQQLLKTQPTDSEAFDSYMLGIYELENRADRENLNQAEELFKESIERDEGYGPAYLGLATTYALMVDYFDADVVEFNELAIQTIEDGIAADPSIENAAGSVRGFVAHKEKDWEAAEEGHLQAVTADLVDANAFNWYSRMLASVGRFDDALVQAQRAVEIEPSNAIANSRLAIMHTWMGNDKLAFEYFERSNELGAGGVNHLMAYAFLLVRNGQFEEARNLTTYGVRLEGARDDWIGPVFAGLADPAHAAAAIEKLNEVDAARAIAPQASLTARAILGDLDGAMGVAELLKLPGEIFEIELLFIPELAALQNHRDFNGLLDDLGIPEYWENRGCEWVDGNVECINLVE